MGVRGWWSGWQGKGWEATKDDSLLGLTHTYIHSHALMQAMEFLNDGAQFEGLAKRWSARKVCKLREQVWIEPVVPFVGHVPFQFLH